MKSVQASQGGKGHRQPSVVYNATDPALYHVHAHPATHWITVMRCQNAGQSLCQSHHVYKTLPVSHAPHSITRIAAAASTFLVIPTCLRSRSCCQHLQPHEPCSPHSVVLFLIYVGALSSGTAPVGSLTFHHTSGPPTRRGPVPAMQQQRDMILYMEQQQHPSVIVTCYRNRLIGRSRPHTNKPHQQ